MTGTVVATEAPAIRRWWALTALGLSLVVLNLNTTTFNIALTTLARDLHADTGGLQWITMSYNLTSAGLLLVAGAIGDRLGRKRALLTGLALFAAASLAGAWASDIGVIVAVRAVMGIGSAIVTTMTLSTITVMFPQRERAKALGIWSATISLGMPLGPIVGGYLLDHFWWGSIFLLNVVAVAVSLPATAALVPESHGRSDAAIDVLGALLSTAGICGVVYGVINAEQSLTSVSAIVPLVVGVALLIAFVLWERRSPHPLVVLSWFSHRQFSGSLVATVLLFFAMLGVLFVGPLYLQGVLGYNALRTGFALVPVAAALVIVSPFVGRLVAVVGARMLVALGLVAIAGGLGLLAVCTPDTPYPVIGCSFALVGLGVGLALPASTTLAVGVLPRDQAGSGAGVINAFRQVGGVLGIAVVGAVVSAIYTSRLAPALTGLPDRTASALRSSVTHVGQVVGGLGPDRGPQVRHAAFVAFTDGMSVVAIICAAVAVATAVAILLFLPAGRPGGDTARP